MEKKKVNKSIVYMITGIVVLVLAIAGSAYAYYSASATGEIVGTAAGSGLELTIEKLSTSANGALIPLDNTTDMLTKAAKGYGNNGSTFDNTKSCIDKNGYTVCQVYKITISNTSTVPVVLNGGVSLYGTNTPNIECSKMASSTSVTDNTSCRGPRTLASNYTLNAGSSNDYYVIVYINNLNEEQEDVGDFNGTITFISSQGKKIKARFGDVYNAVDYITNLYNSASKTTVTNNNITYNYATEVSLMNDRLGGTTSLDGGNIRYYGANPNNYVDIGDGIETRGKWLDLGVSFTSEEECLNYLNCSINYGYFGFSSEEECNSELPSMVQTQFGMTIEELNNNYCVIEEAPKLWRIIGVIDGKVKLIRNESIGDYSWDTSASDINDGYGINEWSQADIMKLLNPGYESETVGGSLWYNKESGTCYSGRDNATTTCDFTSSGLSEEAKDYIVDSTWYLGGGSTARIYSDAALIMERGTNVVAQ